MLQTGLKGKTAIITGASSGIGAESARMLASEGTRVMITGRREENLIRIREEITKAGGSCAYLAGDVGDTEFCGRLVAETVRQFGRVDVLVCSAGMALRKKTLDMPVEEWNQVMNVNLTAPLVLSQACIRQFLLQKAEQEDAAGAGVPEGPCGKIVFISSTAGKNVNMGASPSYGASKAGLLYLTRHLATEFAKERIYVNAICPGPVDTEITNTWTPEHRANVIANLPLGRLGQPEDIANAVVFLAGAMSNNITGESLLVNGGRFME
ncbi:MAG: SDR family oxidoreductase [Lachnospiraceae bacterium]|nr:SDR family oxidoreductase [Lachnospiraceae bacterium]